jgi:hypothetical protein
MYQDSGGNTSAPVSPKSPTEPVLREQFENIINRLYLCNVNAREIEGKIFNPAPMRENSINEKNQSNIENLFAGLYYLTSELEDTLARVNSKL